MENKEIDGAVDKIAFYVNGRKITLQSPDPEMTLLYFLRNHLGLKGTKLGCAEGGCGACTVMVSKYDFNKKEIIHFSVNACLAPLCSVDHMAVTTVEGIGSTRTKIHPVQERIAKAHGSQCGFCTPGIVMSMYTLLRNNTLPSEEEMEKAFEGNLCRCTGYRPILDGYRTFCCKSNGGNCACSKDEHSGIIEGPCALFDPTEFQPLDPTQEPIFPAELMIATLPPPLHIKTDRVQWFRPVTLHQLLSLKAKYQHKVRIVAGNSEIGVEVKFKNAHFPVLISPAHIPEMNIMEETTEGLLIGAACTLTDVEIKMKEICNQLPQSKTRTLVAILEMLRWFAGPQIRNVAVIGGNIVTASPISDLNPILVAAGAILQVISENTPQYTRKMDESFFVSYRKTVLKDEEVLVSLLIPWTQEHEYIYSYKQSPRRDDDIAIVNAGMRVVLKPEETKWTVKEINLVYGGVAPVTKVASQTQAGLIGREWNDSLCDDACSSLIKEMKISLDAPGGRPEFRCALTASFFLKFYLSVKNEINEISEMLLSATKPFHRELTKASQGFQDVASSQPSDDHVGRPLMHLSALQQATGEAIYVDDIPSYRDELYAAIVDSTRPHAEIVNIDISEAEKVEGFVDFISAKDIPEGGSNKTGALGELDEEVFADKEVTCIGQLIGLVVAKTRPLAQRAALLVKIEYKDLPTIITIEDAIAAESYYEPIRSLSSGDAESVLATLPDDQVLSGEIRVSGQEHFYLETQASLVVPKDHGEIEMFVSTQNAHKTQLLAAAALGVPANKVLTRVKRLGGGFGGKETRSCMFSTALAVAANKLQVPVRQMLDRHEDMRTTGTRHPFLGRYKVGFTKDGNLLALDIKSYSNAGNSTDLSLTVMEESMMHCENAYNIPNLTVVGYVCKTNLPSNTAFRSFGRPQSMYMMECIISNVAALCNMPVHKVREQNLYCEGDRIPAKQELTEFHLRRCWNDLMTKINYEDRVAEIEKFNKNNQWKKRGISVIPTKFGVGFYPKVMCKGGALVHVYTDGSVLVTHGGVEMGQGLHTKMVQVCARALGIPPSKVHISEMATNTVANSSPTAASASSDLYGMAVKKACEQIKERLAPYKEANLKGTWKDWVSAAYDDQTNLSAQDFFSLKDIDFDWETKTGRYYDYFTCGVACSEVEVDVLTGGHHIISTDIIMDVGDSLNPALDIGQIEGAFTQGVGLYTMEELIFLEETSRNPRGQMFTNGPGNYKIPCFSDVPIEFNVSLLKGSPNKRAIYSSRAVGEPPLFLGASVAFAIRDAIAYVRRQAGVSECFTLDSPVTCERIRMACPDHITKQVLNHYGPDTGSAKRWNIAV